MKSFAIISLVLLCTIVFGGCFIAERIKCKKARKRNVELISGKYKMGQKTIGKKFRKGGSSCYSWK